jgi:hypothetical protein
MDISKELMEFINQIDKFTKLLEKSVDGIYNELIDVVKISDGILKNLDKFN